MKNALFITIATILILTGCKKDDESNKLAVSVESLVFDSGNAGEMSFDITSGSAWNITVPSGNGWCTVSPVSGNGNSNVAVTTTDNYTDAERKLDITVTSGDQTKTVAVKQPFIAKVLTISKESIDFPTGLQTSSTFDITSNTSWSITAPADNNWCTVTPSSGTGNATVTVAVKTNLSQTRNLALTLTAGSISKTVAVAQTLFMATVPVGAGKFTMGSPASESTYASERPQHEVTLSAFRMGKYEVTNVQFAAFLNDKKIGSDGKYAGGSYPTQLLVVATSGSKDWGLHYNTSSKNWEPAPGKEQHPVIYVSWYAADEFARWVGGKLPTEAQWEYACRAGTTTAFHTGATLTTVQANWGWGDEYQGQVIVPGAPCATVAVGTYAPNAWGLYDMHGNVAEWCSDWLANYTNVPATDPTGPASGAQRVARGGSWMENDRTFCRSAYRIWGNMGDFTGFRVVFTP